MAGSVDPPQFPTARGTYYRIHDGADFLGQSIQPVHFGLGTSSEVERLRVRWPNGFREDFFNVSANQQINIVEGSGVSVATETLPDGVSALRVNTYPLPARNGVTFEIGAPRAGTYSIEVFDLLGRTLHTTSTSITTTSQIELDSAYFEKPGVYLFRVRSDDNRLLKTGTFVMTR